MAQVWILILWHFLNFAQAVDLYQKPSFILAKLGETVTFHCTFAKKHSAESMVWYKQPGAQILQNIVVQSPLMEAIISSEYNKSHLKLERTKTNISFSILHAAKDDGGLYFCGVVVMKTTEFSTGTFLAVFI
uniref:Ig-like domain-containing protein n=1 Tax=Electrophorus electricus TaxID=8005 RepID=A0AAY5EMY7_ELEEL